MTLAVLGPATEERLAELPSAGPGWNGPATIGRELGMHALDGYSEIKSVFISTEG